MICIAPIPLKIESLGFKAQKFLRELQSDIINVPCGRCLNCRRGYINSWVIRLTDEFKAKTTEKAYFLTLTFNDDTLYNSDNGLITEDGEVTLNYRLHQLYMKRLRKNHKGQKIKYFTVGEYGEQTDRPHFHSIIFNASQQEILDAWQYGNVHFGEFNEATIRYTLKYALKRIGRVHDKNYVDKSQTRAPERTLISRGIGLEFITKQSNINFYKDDITRPITREGGQKFGLPRYYRDKLFTESEKLARSVIAYKKMQKESPSTEQLLNARQLTAHEYAKEKKKTAQRAD